MIVVVRHAPVSAATEGRCYGRLDVPTELTHDAAAERILGSVEGGALRTVWSSPISRCAEPARRVAARLDVEHRCDEALCEIDYGDWEGEPWSVLERDDAGRLAAWMSDWQRTAPPNGESLPAFEARVRGWLEGSPSGLLVAHAGVVRALHVLIHGMDWPTAMQRPVPHLEALTFDR